MKKKKNRYLDWCHIPILKGAFIVVCTDDYAWVAKTFNAPDVVDEDMYAVSIHGEYKGLDAYIIVLNLWKESLIYNSIVAHEAVHIAQYILQGRDWKRLKNPEPLAYIVEWFTNKTYQFLKKNKLHTLIVNDNPNQ